MKYKHKIQVVVEVETADPEMPLHSELAQALYQKRKDPLLLDEAVVLDTEQVADKLEHYFNEQVRFGGHKVATSLTIPLPIQTQHVTPMVLHFFNEGTEKEMHRNFKRRLNKVMYNEGKYLLTFIYENTKFTFEVDENHVVEPTKFTFDPKT